MAILLGGRPPFSFLLEISFLHIYRGFRRTLTGESRDDDTHDTIKALVLAILYFYFYCYRSPVTLDETSRP